MFILLILFTQASCDWVEISQNHYKKEPIREVSFERTTKSNVIYRNGSLTERQWHKGAVDRVSNIANIRKVQHPSVKTNSYRIGYEANTFNNNFNDQTDSTEADYNFISTKTNTQKPNKFYEANDDLDNLSKVSFSATTTAYVDQVKRPNLKPVKNPSTAIATVNANRRKQYGENIVDVNDVHNTNQRKIVHIMRPSLDFKSNDNLSFEKNGKFSTIERPNLQWDSVKDNVNSGGPIKYENRYANTSIRMEANLSKNKILTHTEDFKDNNVYRETISNKNVKRIKNNPFETNPHPLENFDSKNEFRNSAVHKDENSEKVIESNPDKQIQNNIKESIPSNNNKETEFSSTQNSNPKDLLDVAKETPVKGVWKLVKIVADTIYKNTHRSFKSKIKYLENLKTTILTSIENQIDSAWPDDVQDALIQPRRSSRATQPRGHVEFPSSESTLMTISFLTFAVFLIKLVLQVIHTYKNKTMMVTPAVVAAVGRAAAAIRTP